MCGIAGFIGPAGAPGDAALVASRMAQAIAQRGPDDHGVWIDAEAGLALAHRRLSIVDLTPAGHQPMLGGSGRFVIAFNGEIYNHAALRAELEAAGAAPQWRGHCDTEVLLAAIVAWGLRPTLERAVGIFAFALWDRRERTLVLARDRLGEKPLYYGWAGRNFLFGSELAALAAHPAWEGQIDRDALAQLVRLNYIPAPLSIYKGIGKVMPGTYQVLRAGAQDTRAETYWDARAVVAQGARAPFAGSAEEAVERTEALIRQSLQGQMMADVPLGAFLSGGIDSSTVVALMQATSSRPVQTFSIGFDERGYDEAPHARTVARHLGTEHTELYVTMRDAMAVVPELPSLYNEPFADVSQIPTFLVSQLARRHVTVALSGDGGDELFSGYTRYAIGDRLWRILSRLPRRARTAVASVLRRVPARRWDGLLRGPLQLVPERTRPRLVGDKLNKLAGVIELDGSDAIYDALTALWPDPGRVVIGAGMTQAASEVSGPDDPVRRMMLSDLTCYLPDDILVKVDRASMAVGLEARVPLLDHRLVEFSATLPMDVLRRNGQSKWPLRRVLDQHVPNAITERPKMGFGVPIDGWLRGGLRDWAEHLLDARRLAQEGYFQPGPIRAAWQDHLDGHRNMQYQLWSVLMFQAWNDEQRAARVLPPRREMAATSTGI